MNDMKKITYLESLDLALQALDEVLHVAAVQALLALFLGGVWSRCLQRQVVNLLDVFHVVVNGRFVHLGKSL